MIKNENRGRFIDHQRKGVGVGEKKIDFLYFFPSRALADVFEKNEEKNKTTSVYRLVSQSVSQSVC